jgi:transposase
MKKPSTRTVRRRGKLPDGQPTIGLDLGDQSSFYCVLNGTGEVILEERITQMTTCGSLSPVLGAFPKRSCGSLDPSHLDP